MQGKNTKNKAERFTIIYFENLWDLKIDFTEYMILKYMINHSNRNVFRGNIVKMCEYLGICRTTFYNTNIENLFKSEHIEKDFGNKNYYIINHDVAERISQKDGHYIIIYHNWKKWKTVRGNRVIPLNDINQYVFLYIIYSLSRNKKKGIALVGKNYLKRHIGLKERNFFKVRDKLINKELLSYPKTNHYMLSRRLFFSFNNRACSNSS